MWPAELKAQYTRVYSNRKRVESLLSLENEPGWTVKSNFHLAYKNAHPRQRWYPGRHLPASDYLNGWIDDLARSRAGGRRRDEIADPAFFRWLLERGYAQESEQRSLANWLSSKPSGMQIHIRPSIRVVRSWPYAHANKQDYKGQFVADVRETINKVLRALNEPGLEALHVGETPQRRTAREPKPQGRIADATRTTACPTCHMVHAGECP